MIIPHDAGLTAVLVVEGVEMHLDIEDGFMISFSVDHTTTGWPKQPRVLGDAQ